VHVKGISGGLGLCAEGAGDYEVFRAVGRLARNAGVTPYNADKLFWLVGSGYFYDDPHIGNKGRIGRHKEEFIEVARESLGLERHHIHHIHPNDSTITAYFLPQPPP
jgi:hypothetical protein